MQLFPDQVLEECASTNDLAKILAANGAPHGSWISAKKQSAGRGRLGRKWEGLDGNLFLSILIRDVPSSLWTWIPLATAVAIQTTLKALLPEIPILIKWPNDLGILTHSGAQSVFSKVGGILCEGQSGYVVIGIGLNCLHSPQGISQPCTSLTEALSANPGEPLSIHADQVRIPLKEAVLTQINHLALGHQDLILRSYELCALFQKGGLIQWGNPAETGKVEGLGPQAELRVQMENRIIKSLYAEEVHQLTAKR